MTTQTKKTPIYVIIAIVGLVFIIWFSSKDNSKPITPEIKTIDYYSHDTRLDAYQLMKKIITENYLKAPATAKFAGFSEAEIKYTNLGDKVHVYTIKSYVDSQNSFGAMIRTHFQCIMTTGDGKNYVLSNFETAE